MARRSSRNLSVDDLIPTRGNDRKNMDLQKEMDPGDESLGKRISMLRAMVVNEYARKAKPGPVKPKGTESQG